MKSRTGIAIANIGEPAPESSLKSAGGRRTPSEKQRLTARQPCGVTLAIRRNSPERKPASRTEVAIEGLCSGCALFVDLVREL